MSEHPARQEVPTATGIGITRNIRSAEADEIVVCRYTVDVAILRRGYASGPRQEGSLIIAPSLSLISTPIIQFDAAGTD